MVKQLVQDLVIDKLQRWPCESSSLNEDPSPASKGRAAEPQGDDHILRGPRRGPWTKDETLFLHLTVQGSFILSRDRRLLGAGAGSPPRSDRAHSRQSPASPGLGLNRWGFWVLCPSRAAVQRVSERSS